LQTEKLKVSKEPSSATSTAATSTAVPEDGYDHSQMQQEKLALHKAVSDYSVFLSRVINTSARPVLSDTLDMSNAELLGMGNYGFIMVSRSKESNHQVVLKLQGTHRRCGQLVNPS